MHFQAMFFFVHAPRHGLKAPLFLYLFDERSVYDQVAEGGAVLVAFGRRCAGEVVVVGWAEEEDALPVSGVNTRVSF
jgi:hypothetical protein